MTENVSVPDPFRAGVIRHNGYFEAALTPLMAWAIVNKRLLPDGKNVEDEPVRFAKCCVAGCFASAQWEIHTEGRGGRIGYACADHLGYVLDDDRIHTIHPFQSHIIDVANQEFQHI